MMLKRKPTTASANLPMNIKAVPVTAELTELALALTMARISQRNALRLVEMCV